MYREVKILFLNSRKLWRAIMFLIYHIHGSLHDFQLFCVVKCLINPFAFDALFHRQRNCSNLHPNLEYHHRLDFESFKEHVGFSSKK